MPRPTRLALFTLLMIVSPACSSEGTAPARQASDSLTTSTSAAWVEPGESSSTTDAATTTSTIGEAASEAQPTAFNGRPVPIAPSTPEEAVVAFTEVQQALRVDGRDPGYYADVGHTEQLVVRTLSRNPDWVDEVTSALPDELKPILALHLTARAELGSLHTAPPLEVLPAWEIIEPAPLDDLIGYYQDASADTGIDWQVLAAINLIETGMGRIDGLSSAGAQGPMQFLPTTWAEVSEGGDIDDPRDAIGGAARYLVQRGGLDDIGAGLFGYNNSDNYVNAVLAYAELIRLDERALRGLYNWEIYVGTDVGTLWLPVGLTTDGSLTAADYLADNPWARTLG